MLYCAFIEDLLSGWMEEEAKSCVNGQMEEYVLDYITITERSACNSGIDRACYSHPILAIGPDP